MNHTTNIDTSAWLTLHANKTLSGSPTNIATQNITITINADDQTSEISHITEVFKLLVTHNAPPTLLTAIPDVLKSVEYAYSLDISSHFTEPNSEVMTYVFTSVPDITIWATLDSAAGTIIGTPGLLHFATYVVTLNVRDVKYPTTLQTTETFNI